MKAPDHAVPSGDRRIARLLIQALESLGHSVTLMSGLRLYDKTGDRAAQVLQEQAAAAECREILARFARQEIPRPDAWFTYHSYYKAPDLLGPAITAELGIPYVLAEASLAEKRAQGPWAHWHAKARAAIEAATAIFSFTALDKENLARFVLAEKLYPLPPFLDLAPFAATRRRDHLRRMVAGHTEWPLSDEPWLIAVGMMRRRDKLPSYLRLADALGLAKDLSWRLMIVGDGEARSEVEAAYRAFGHRVHYFGERTEAELIDLYGAADMYVWPAIGEAFGMAPLEAQAAGLPVVAGNIRGLPDVVKDGITGFLCADTAADFAVKLRRLILNPSERRQMGAAARALVFGERGLDHGARYLAAAFDKW